MSINTAEGARKRTRRAFLEAGIELILERGYDHVSVADIARRFRTHLLGAFVALPVAAWLAARRIGRETVTYVSNIFKYYVGYQIAAERRSLRAERYADLLTVCD